MFGHGSSHCRVKTFCAKCAGPHKTADCKEANVKCANCSGEHTSNSEICPSRDTYIKIKQRSQSKRRPAAAANNNNINNPGTSDYNIRYPNTLRQNGTASSGMWNVPRTQSRNCISPNNFSNDLFSTEEIRQLTIELIDKLKRCRNKADQFEVITTLACTFLS